MVRYFDPQYFIRQQLTTASDVYGYGVVLLELVTGQRAIDHTRISNFNLVEWVGPHVQTMQLDRLRTINYNQCFMPSLFVSLGLQVRPKLKEEGIRAIVDPKLGDDYPEDIYQDMAKLGLQCALFDKDSRPTMKVQPSSSSCTFCCFSSSSFRYLGDSLNLVVERN